MKTRSEGRAVDRSIPDFRALTTVCVSVNLTLLMPGLRRQQVVQGHLSKVGNLFKTLVLGKPKRK